MEKQIKQKHSTRLVFVLFPFQGHLTPMLQLATVFYSKGFSITIIHPELNSPDPSNLPADFELIPIPEISSSSQTKISPANFIDFVDAINRYSEEPFKLCVERLMLKADQEDGEDGRISCIIYDFLMYFSQRVADHFKLPGLVVRTSPAATIFTSSVFPRLDGQGYISLLDLMSEDQDPELESLRLKEQASASPTSQVLPDKLLEVRAVVTHLTKKSSAIIINTTDFLEQAALTKLKQFFLPPIFTIGPFHKLAPTISTSLLKEDNSCISWLNKQKQDSVIYISFGSVVDLNDNDLIEIAWGLANSDQSFLWVVRPDMIHSAAKLSELLPDAFQEQVGERGFIVKWAPQKEVLAHCAVGGFMSHGGWNSTFESISEGVPILCKPFFGDQGLNVRYICDVWKVGLEMEKEIERGTIEKDVRRLMEGSEGEEMRKRALELKMKIDLCLKEGGSSYNSLNTLMEKISSF